jgi:hypothetical protein
VGDPGSHLYGLTFRVAFKLHSRDGKREVEVRKFSNGETYLIERERGEGETFIDRYDGRHVGPFTSPEHAESFIVATAWFCGHEDSPQGNP